MRVGRGTELHDDTALHPVPLNGGVGHECEAWADEVVLVAAGLFYLAYPFLPLLILEDEKVADVEGRRPSIKHDEP